MKKDKTGKKPHKGGRPPKSDPAIYHYNFKLNAAEKLAFDRMLERSGIDNMSRFIKHILFGKEIKVVKLDKGSMDYYIRLTEFYRQFQAVGNNYNQTVKAIKSNFGEKRGLAMLYKLEKATIELVLIGKQITALTREYEEKYLSEWLRK